MKNVSTVDGIRLVADDLIIMGAIEMIMSKISREQMLKKLGISEVTFRRKKSGESDWTKSELKRIEKLYATIYH